MDEPEKTGLALISEAARGVSAPVHTAFLKAASNLLGGLTAIPAAWLKRPAQAVEDTTAARSAVAAMIAKAVADEAIKDPALMVAAAEIYLPSAVRKASNKFKVAQSAAERLAATAAEGPQPAPPDDDWMNRFMRSAEDASSERLQDLFGRILAGEVVRPGSFCAATLRAVGELDQPLAADFTWAWERSVGKSIDNTPELNRGDGFNRWRRLSEAGLMSISGMTQHLPPFNPGFRGRSLWSPMSAGGVFVMIAFEQGSAVGWDNIAFTRAGREIGGLLPRPDYEANIRAAAKRLPTSGLTHIELHCPHRPPELIWRSSETEPHPLFGTSKVVEVSPASFQLRD